MAQAPARVTKIAIALKRSTYLRFHQASSWNDKEISPLSKPRVTSVYVNAP